MARTRDSVVGVLQLLSSKEAQYERYCRATDDPDHEREVNLAHELWELWSRTMNAAQSSRSPHGFSPAVHDGLARFTQFLHARLPLFPHRFESLMLDVHWRTVTEYAAVLLEQVAQSAHPENTDG